MGRYDLRAPVAIWLETPTAVRSAVSRLAQASIDSIVVTDSEALTDICNAVDVCVAPQDRLDTPAIRLRLLRVARSSPLRPRILVLGERSHFGPQWLPRHWHHCPAVRSLPQTVFEARIAAWREGVAARIRGAAHLPFVVREALVTVLMQDFPPDVEEREVLHTIARTARAVGVRREHLSRLMHSAKLNFRTFTDSFLSVRAIAAHELGGSSWTALATRLGFESPSALTSLVKRGAGVCPSVAAECRAIDEWLAWWEATVLDDVLSTNTSQ